MVDTGTFTPPGPGRWELDRSHYPGGTTPISQWLMQACPAAMARAFAELGVPADTLDVRFVDGFMYSRLRPLVRPDHPSTRLPPLPLLRVLTRLHPGMRARAATAARQLERRPWRQVVADWPAVTRPRLEARNRALQAVALGSLDDAALSAHAAEVLAWCRETFELHFWLHTFDLGPIGMLLYETDRWGIPAGEVVPALGGASPSTSAPAAVLSALRQEIEASGTVPTTLDDVRACSPTARHLLDEYLERCGSMMVTRYDLDGQTLAERPDTVLASILHAPTGPVDHRLADTAAEALRSRVPAGEHRLLEERLREARAAMDLRDDNGPYTVEWPVGLLRRALLEIGRRAVAAGRWASAELALELRPDEVAVAAAGRGPDGAELVARQAARADSAVLNPPPTLGPAEPAPPLSVLASPHRILVGAVQAVLAHLGMTPGDAAVVDGLSGVGIGAEPYTGRARLARDPEAALDVMEPGDVLVVRFTTPAYNTVLSLAGAVVTADGGPLCHAAVMARELGIPAVVGAARALDDIGEGDLVEVDPAAGRVRVVGTTPAAAHGSTIG